LLPDHLKPLGPREGVEPGEPAQRHP
jgi:hypothetical protein